MAFNIETECNVFGMKCAKKIMKNAVFGTWLAGSGPSGNPKPRLHLRLFKAVALIRLAVAMDRRRARLSQTDKRLQVYSIDIIVDEIC